MASSTESTAQPAAPKLSPVEGFKDQSRQLRGTIALELVEPADHFTEANKQLLKFHGTYQQEDRDARKDRAQGRSWASTTCSWSAAKSPAADSTAAQYLAMDDLAGKLRQWHAALHHPARHPVARRPQGSNLKATIAGINDCLLTTLGACGDVERNVMACPAPHRTMASTRNCRRPAADLAAHLAPRTGLSRNLAQRRAWSRSRRPIDARSG